MYGFVFQMFLIQNKIRNQQESISSIILISYITIRIFISYISIVSIFTIRIPMFLVFYLRWVILTLLQTIWIPNDFYHFKHQTKCFKSQKLRKHNMILLSSRVVIFIFITSFYGKLVNSFFIWPHSSDWVILLILRIFICRPSILFFLSFFVDHSIDTKLALPKAM